MAPKIGHSSCCRHAPALPSKSTDTIVASCQVRTQVRSYCQNEKMSVFNYSSSKNEKKKKKKNDTHSVQLDSHR